MVKPLQRLREFIERSFAREHAELTRLQRLLVAQVRLYVHVAREITRGGYLQRAAALTFASLVALIPLITVSFAIYNAFGGVSQEQIESWTAGVLQEYFLGGHRQPEALVNVIPVALWGAPQTGGETAAPVVYWVFAPRPELQSGAGAAIVLGNWSQRIAASIVTLAHRASSAGFTAAGAVLLIITAVLLFNTVEGGLNAIWHVERRRAFRVRFAAFCTILFLSPLLIGVSVYLSQVLQPLRRSLESVPALGALVARVSLHMPAVLIMWVVFYLAYTLIPNTRVRWRNALLGAGIAAVLWELAKMGFGLYIMRMTNYHRLYGSLSAVPIFMLWVFLTWIIVLFGAGVSYTTQNLHSLVLETYEARRGPTVSPYLAAALVYLIARRFARGGGPAPLHELAAATDTTEEGVSAAVEPLVAARLISRVADGVTAYQPARPLDAITWHEIFAVVRGVNTYRLRGREVQKIVDAVFRRVDEAEGRGLKDYTLQDMITSSLDGEGAGSEVRTPCEDS